MGFLQRPCIWIISGDSSLICKIKDFPLIELENSSEVNQYESIPIDFWLFTRLSMAIDIPPSFLPFECELIVSFPVSLTILS